MLRSSRNRLDLAIVFAVAAAANFAYLILSNGDFYYPDSFTYLAPASNLLHGLGFVDKFQAVETIRTPVYPLLLALFGARTLPVIILQHLLNVALALGIYVFVIRRSGSRLMAMTASLLFALDVPSIHYANKVLTETPFTALLYVVFVLALQKPRLIVLALLTGVMVLLRPIAIFFFVALALFFVMQRFPVRQIVAFIVVALVLPVGWAVRNQVRTGVFTVSSIGGINMLNARAAGALAIEDEGDFQKALAEEQSALADEADDDIQEQLHIPDARELPDNVRASYYSRFALRVIGEHPLSFLQLTIRGVLVNLFDSDWDAVWNVSQVSPSVLQLVFGTIPIIVFVFATIGTMALWRNDRALALLILIVVGYFIGISAGAEAESRFRVPVMPEMAIAAAAGVAAVRRALRPTTSARRTPADDDSRRRGSIDLVLQKHQEAIACHRPVVEDLIAELENDRRLAGRSVGMKFRDHQFLAIDKIDLPAIATEAHSLAAFRRHRASRSRPWKRSHVDLKGAGDIGAVGDPFAVG